MARKSAKGIDAASVGAGDGLVSDDSAGVGFGTGIGGVESFDPASVAPAPGIDGNGGGDSKPKRGRGRPAGGGNAAAKTEEISYSVSGVETILLSMHEILSKALKVDLLMIDKREANAMAKAIGEVAKHYPVKVDPKMAAWTNLVMVAGAVYGPRIAVARMVAKTNAAARRAEVERDNQRAMSPEFSVAH